MKFKDLNYPLFSSSMPCASIVQSSYLNSTFKEVDFLVNNFTSSLGTTLDPVAPLIKKFHNHKYICCDA